MRSESRGARSSRSNSLLYVRVDSSPQQHQRIKAISADWITELTVMVILQRDREKEAGEG